MIVGLQYATSSKLAVISGIIIMAIADGLSDSVSLHTAQESQMEKGKIKYTTKQIWITTILTFFSILIFSLSFVVPILFLSINLAIFVDIVWGILLIIFLNFLIGRIRKENPLKCITEHVALVILVIIIAYFVGNIIALEFG